MNDTMIKQYTVTVTTRYPVAGERPGFIEVDARNTREAIRKARQEMSDRGYTRQDGPFSYTAVISR